MKRIAVFGGTFNPVHVEHEKMVDFILKELNLDKIIVVPTNIPPHKKTELAKNEDRLSMLKLCFKDNEKVEVSDFELNNGGTSYSYITVEHFASVYPNAELFFLVGGDMLKDFKTWKNPERILNSATLVAIGREDYKVDYLKEEEYFKKTFNKSFIRLTYDGKDVSSTRIRIYSALGLDVKNMVNKEVNEYIRENKLFQGKKEFEFIKKTLPEKRLIHTAEVTVTALKKVRELGLDKDKVITSCILHDCAKYIDYKSVKGFKLDGDVPKPVIHSFLGGYIVRHHLKIEDEEVIDAITYHTSGKANMTTLGKLLFVADMIEPTRDYEGVETLREIFEEDFERCFIECLKEETIHLVNKKEPIFIETLNAYDYYVNKK